MRPSLAFGWWVVAGAALADLVATGQQQATSVIMGPMLADIGWSRTGYSVALLLAPLAASAVALAAGRYAARRGGSALLVAGALITAGGLFGAGASRELWQFWLTRGVLLGAGSGLIGAAVVGGTLARWFDERRSWALTLAALGGALWMALGTSAMRVVVDAYGWRLGWNALGAASLLLLPAATLLRGQPLESGRDRDGYRWVRDVARADVDAGSLYRNEATRTPAFWLLVLGCALPLVSATALATHLVQHFADIGFTRSEATMLVGVAGIGVGLGAVGWRGLTGRAPALTLLASSFVLAGAGTLAIVYFAVSASISAVAGLCLVLGIGTGGLVPLIEEAWEQCFGRGHVTEIRALALPLMLASSGAGAMGAALSFDSTGSYNLALAGFAVLWFTGALLVLAVRAPLRAAAVPLAERLRQHVPGVPDSPAALAMHGAMPADVPARVEVAAVELAVTEAASAAEAVDDLDDDLEDDLDDEEELEEEAVTAALGQTLEPGTLVEPGGRPVRVPARSYMGTPPDAAEALLDLPDDGAPSSENPPSLPAREDLVSGELDRPSPVEAQEPDLPRDEADDSSDDVDADEPLLEVQVESTPLWRPPSVVALVEVPVEPGEPDSVDAPLEDVADELPGELLAEASGVSAAEHDANVGVDVDASAFEWADVLDEDSEPEEAPSSALRVVAPLVPVRRVPDEPLWVPHTTNQAIAAGVVASLVATLVLWFLTRSDSPED